MTTIPPKKNSKLNYIFLIITLFMLFFAFSKNKDYNKLKDVLTQDKIELQAELNQIVNNYKKLNVKNKKLSSRVINEINKILALKDSVKNLKAENFSLIRNYRKKTLALQKENRILINKVDSLNTINSNLIKENILVTKKLNRKDILTTNLKKQNIQLVEVNKNLENKLAPAKKIKVSPINIVAMKERNSGKLATTSKHNKTDAIRINFKLLQNNLTIPGFKKIYIQIIDKNNNVIASENKKAILNNNKKIKYSDELIADYNNEELDVLSLILVDRTEMEKGDYKINVFVDGNFSSSSIVALK